MTRTLFLTLLTIPFLGCSAAVLDDAPTNLDAQPSPSISSGSISPLSTSPPTSWSEVVPGVDQRMTEDGGLVQRVRDRRGLAWMATRVERELGTSAISSARQRQLTSVLATIQQASGEGSVDGELPTRNTPPPASVCLEFAEARGDIVCGCAKTAPYAPYYEVTASARWQSCTKLKGRADASALDSLGNEIESNGSTTSALSGNVVAQVREMALPGGTYYGSASSLVSGSAGPDGPVNRQFNLSIASCTVPAVCPDCSTAGECKDPGKPICDYRCRACRTDSECGAKSGGTPFCNAGQCVACRSSRDCSGNSEICDDTTKTCRPCSGSGQCLARDRNYPVCSGRSYTCVQCEADAHCAGRAKPRCNFAETTCVECLSNSDCPSYKHLCQTNSCVECVYDSDCPTNECNGGRCARPMDICRNCIGDQRCCSLGDGTYGCRHTCAPGT